MSRTPVPGHPGPQEIAAVYERSRHADGTVHCGHCHDPIEANQEPHVERLVPRNHLRDWNTHTLFAHSKLPPSARREFEALPSFEQRLLVGEILAGIDNLGPIHRACFYTKHNDARYTPDLAHFINLKPSAPEALEVAEAAQPLLALVRETPARRIQSISRQLREAPLPILYSCQKVLSQEVDVLLKAIKKEKPSAIIDGKKHYDAPQAVEIMSELNRIRPKVRFVRELLQDRIDTTLAAGR